jgi:hypothetical protein
MNEQQLAAVKQALEALEMVAARTGARWALEQGYAGHLEAITTLQSIISQDALDKMAENARELGLDYETPPKAQTEADKTAYAFGWCKAMEYARQNGVITSQPVPVKTYSGGKPWPVAPKPWVDLTDEEIDLFINGRGDEDDDNYVEPTGDGFGLTDADLVTLVRRAEAKLKEKNHG